MKNSKLKDLSEKILNLEQKCQNGENVSKNLKEIEAIADQLSMSELLELAAYLEENYLKL